ncbi:MAG TPA: hypothetical protein VFA04_10395 [Bryobacteraceae bacterium]|nr:hypothetical protein [Bryobacteraceae bacterium]
MKLSRIAILVCCAAVAAIAQPVINTGGVVNAASYSLAGEPNSSIAQGSMFTLFGSNFAPVTDAPVRASSFPLPTSAGLDGVTVTITVGNITRNGILLWVWNKGNTTGGWESALSAILPFDVPVGTGSITVTYQGVNSNSAPLTVVASSFGIFTINEAGSGPAIVTDINHTSGPYQVLTPTNVASTGDNLTIWGTGLGAYAENYDETNPPPGGLNVESLVNATVYVGTTPVVPSYAGHSGSYPALDQINFVLPPDISGCYVPISVAIGNTVSNFGTIAVNSNASGSPAGCSDPFGYSAQDLGILKTKGSFNFGVIELQRAAVPANNAVTNQDQALAYFETIKAASLSSTPSPLGVASNNSCIVQQFTGGAPLPPFVGGGLDAGSNISVTGPKTSAKLAETTVGQYFVATTTGLFPAGFLDTTGTYTFAGTGGADVGSFSAPVTFPLSNSITWTNQSLTTIDRTKSQEIDWTGGGANNGVEIIGASYTGNNSTSPGAEFACFTTATAGKFTIPAFVLEALPAGTGNIEVFQFALDSFTAPGLDKGFTVASVATQANVTFQ